MYKKSMSVIVVLCLLGMGSVAFGKFGGPWTFQGDWHNTDTSMCKPAFNAPQTNDWYDFNNWGMQNNGCDTQGNGCNGCAVTLFDNYIFLAVEGKLPEPCVSTWNPQYPGADANGYDLYATQVFVMPWSWGNDTTQAGFRMTIEGGNINAGRIMALAYNVPWPAAWNAYPILDVNGGTVYTPGYRNFDANFPYDPTKWDDPNYPWVLGEGLWVGGGGTGTGENWGIVNIRNTGKIIVPRIRIYNGEVNIFEYGLLYDNNSDPNMFFISNARARNKINVAGGELRLAGDRREQVNYFLARNRLIPCGGHGDLHTDFNGSDTSVTATCTPDSAWAPNPIDGAIGVPLNKVFSWSPGPSTQPLGSGTARDVYFGTSETDVCDANLINHRGVYQTSTDACSFDPGVLVMDTNYFWRVDEHNDVAIPPVIFKGNIWAFKSKGPQATDPIPADLATGIPLPIVLKWSPGAKVAGPNSHAVFFGTSRDNVASASATNPLGCFKGYVVDPVYKLSNLDFNLAADTNYYWKINESNGIDVWQGEVWQVLNANYYVVEDFDLYTDNATMYAKWKMGSADYMPCPVGYGPSNGVIDLDINDGENKHMQYDYDDSFGESFSEVRFDATGGDVGGSDWSGGDALPDDNKCRSLAIGFIGNVNNQANGDYDRMYAAIEDTSANFAMVSNSDFQAQRSFGWTQWYIDLASFTGVTKTNVKYLYVGFGGRCLANGSGLGGTGRVRFDDFRLYQKTCLPQFLPVGDLSGDCKVDYTDLDTMASAWVAKQVIITSPVNPGTTGLRLWYKFEETTGTSIADSSGNNYKGEVNSTPQFGSIDIGLTTGLWNPTGGYDGNGCFVSAPFAIRDFNMSIEANSLALSPTQTSLTLSLWVNGDLYMPLSGWARIICAFQDINLTTDDDNEVLEIQCPVPREGATGCTARFKIGPSVAVEQNSVASPGLPLSAFAGSWQHYAFVRAGADANVPDGNYNRIQLYHNGERIADANAFDSNSQSKPFRYNAKFESFRLIRRNQGSESWYGKIDDFRVYNRALSKEEIGWLGTKGTGKVPFANPSNLKSSAPDPEKISFNDYALLAQNWLVFQSWPNP